MENRRLLVLDTETTGLDLENGDRVIEIGIIELIDGVKTGHNFQQYFNPNKKIEKSAQDIHGLTNEFLSDKPNFYEIADEFNDYIKESTLIIHNASFDIKFLDFELENCGKKKINNEIIDTLNIAKKEFPGQSVSLDSLCKKLQINNSHRKLHGALLDADLLSSVYLKMSTGKQSSLELQSNMIHDEFNDNLKVNQSNKFYQIRNDLIYLPDSEYKEHDEFIKKFSSPIWKEIEKN